MVAARKTSPKERTGRLLVEAARAQLRDGAPLTVQAVADRAGVSRATAYRYFRHNDTVAARARQPETADPLTDPEWPYARPDPEDDVVQQVVDLVRGMSEWAFDHQRELQTLLALSLQPDAHERGLTRTGHLNRFRLVDAVLASLPAEVSPTAKRRLGLALVPLFGSDAVSWTTQAAELDRAEAIEQLVWTARTLVTAVLAGAEGSDAS